jgi:hypothetical protein
MKRTVGDRDGEEEPLEGPEHKLVKEDDELEAVLQLSADDFECVICCGKLPRSAGVGRAPCAEVLRLVL